MNDPRPAALVIGLVLAGIALWLIAGGSEPADPRGNAPQQDEVAGDPKPRSRGAGVGAASPSGIPARVGGERTEIASTPPDDPALSPLIVRGRVVDDLGAPVPGAEVTVGRAPARPVGFGGSWSGSGGRAEVPVLDLQEVMAVRPVPPTGSPNRLVAGTPQPTTFAITLTSGDSITIGTTFEVDPYSAGANPIELLFAPTLGPSLVAETDADGVFEVRGEGIEPALVVAATADEHLGDSTRATSLGAEVLLTLRRAALLESEVLLPDWLPPDAVDLSATPADGGETMPAFPVADGEPGRVVLSLGYVAPGIHDLVVTVRGMPEPVFRVPDLSLVVGEQQPDRRAASIDLTHAVFRYEVRAVDVLGARLGNLASPLLARVGDGDGQAWAAFPWRDGRVEFFAPRAAVEVVALAPGFRLQERTLHAGESDLVFSSFQPVEVVLPGLRGLCGSERKVRISMVKQGGTGLPTSIAATDPRSGETQTYSRWHLGMSSGAWLGASDTVLVPLVLDGRYEVIVRLFEEGVFGDHSLTCAEADVVLDGLVRPRVTVAIDADRIRAGLEDLRRRASR